jgi:broad specificity phosphatase PhoE
LPIASGAGRIARLFLFLVLACAAAQAADDSPEALWKRLRDGGHVVLIRHAATGPGLGDPPGYRIDDCASQRNLSDEGRADAAKIGAAFKRERVAVDRVYASPWCRCLDTARIAFGAAEAWEPLGSFFDVPHRETEMTESVKRRISGYGTKKPHGNIVMVTHNTNIAALTRLSVGTGEIVVVKPDGCCGLRVIGRMVVR